MVTTLLQRRKTHFPLLFFLFVVVFIASSILYNERSIQLIHPQTRSEEDQDHPPHGTRHLNGLDRFSRCRSTKKFGSSGRGGRKERLDRDELEFDHYRKTGPPNGCEVFFGKWVFDNNSHPLYDESECPYTLDQLACHKHGRSDLSYQFWRWQPHGCNLRRWDVMAMWEKLQGKRLMFVGDSLNRGQWISMDYNATLEFLWAPLVESNSDDPVNHRLDERIIRPDSLLYHASHWENADILVFSSYLWWRQGPVKLSWSSEEREVCEELDGLGAMEAWADWVASKVDPLKKRVFFVTMSSTHLWNREWEPGREVNCYNEETPINADGYWGSGSDLPTMRMVERVLRRLGSKVTVLNITQLSEYRKDGHPSIFRKFWEKLSSEQLAKPSSYSDCIHLCLPGVPDVWNELVYHFFIGNIKDTNICSGKI